MTTATIHIIGAGLAGLAATQPLVPAGRHVLVLEGRSRLGGRIWTDQLGGAPVELGAVWLHDSRHHSLWPLARRLKMTLVATEPTQGALLADRKDSCEMGP